MCSLWYLVCTCKLASLQEIQRVVLNVSTGWLTLPLIREIIPNVLNLWTAPLTAFLSNIIQSHSPVSSFLLPHPRLIQSSVQHVEWYHFNNIAYLRRLYKADLCLFRNIFKMYHEFIFTRLNMWNLDICHELCVCFIILKPSSTAPKARSKSGVGHLVQGKTSFYPFTPKNQVGLSQICALKWSNRS